MVFQQNLLEKAYFIAKKSGPAMVRPASSDFWKAPLVPVFGMKIKLAKNAGIRVIMHVLFPPAFIV